MSNYFNFVYGATCIYWCRYDGLYWNLEINIEPKNRATSQSDKSNNNKQMWLICLAYLIFSVTWSHDLVLWHECMYQTKLGKSIQMISRWIWCCSKLEFVLGLWINSGQHIQIRKGNNYGCGRCDFQDENNVCWMSGRPWKVMLTCILPWYSSSPCLINWSNRLYHVYVVESLWVNSFRMGTDFRRLMSKAFKKSKNFIMTVDP